MDTTLAHLNPLILFCNSDTSVAAMKILITLALFSFTAAAGLPVSKVSFSFFYKIAISFIDPFLCYIYIKGSFALNIQPYVNVCNTFSFQKQIV